MHKTCSMHPLIASYLLLATHAYLWLIQNLSRCSYQYFLACIVAVIKYKMLFVSFYQFKYIYNFFEFVLKFLLKISKYINNACILYHVFKGIGVF